MRLERAHPEQDDGAGPIQGLEDRRRELLEVEHAHRSIPSRVGSDRGGGTTLAISCLHSAVT